MLISGRIFEFILPLLEQFQTHKLCGVCDTHYSGRLRKGRPTANDSTISRRIEVLDTLAWHRVKHSNSGGSTEFVALVVHNQSIVMPPISRIQRGITHVFIPSIRPGPPPKVLPIDRVGRFYDMEDRLIPSMYHLPVYCHSQFHSTGRGFRVLTIDELANAHGFPRPLIRPNFPRDLLSLPPCQLLHANLKLLWSLAPVPELSETPRSQNRLKELFTYIPSLKKFLCHSWVEESLVTAKASKVDNAVAPCGLWDARLELQSLKCCEME